MSDDDESKQDNREQNSESLAVQNIMRTEGGRDFIWGQLQSDGVFESIFDADPVKAGYNSGMRDSGLRLERVIKEAAPEFYLKMVQENLNR